MTRTQSLLLSSMLTIAVVSCQSSEPEPPPAPAAEPNATGSAAPDPVATDAPTPPASEEVAYEPAYPADVSSEGLSDEDEAQQKAGHSHGDATHSHGEDENQADHDH